MTKPYRLHLFIASILLLLFPFYTSSSSETPQITLKLHHFPSTTPHPDPFRNLAALASASLLRARHIKSSQTTPLPSHFPLYPHSYGGYSFDLNFGTPPQTITLLLDTGSHLTWVPCTKSYLCRNCSSPGNLIPNIPTFSPKLSSSARILGCKSPKCSWFQSQNTIAACRNCPSNSSSNCPQICPPYLITYGLGSTAGILLSETLDLGNQKADNFIVGCSVFSVRQPAGGIVGFGRGDGSFPSQLGAKRFSYCLISRRFDDDAGEAGSVVIGGERQDSSSGFQFTPLIRNPTADSESVSSVYYYVSLKKISVGGKKVKIPREALSPRVDGSGGTIVDSGTTFTYLEGAVGEAVVAAFVAAVAGRYNRSVMAETATGLRPCFQVPATGNVELPEFGLQFKGGTELVLPVANYFVLAGDPAAAATSACLAIIGDEFGHGGVGGGPAVILGSFQQQNYQVVYDLERERIGFRRQSCLNS